MSADVAGYSRLMGQDESGTLVALKALRRDTVDPAIAKHRGRIVKTTGDGLMLEFQSVVDAVRCAVEEQTAMAARGDGPEDRRIVFRIGVNVAARLEGIAEPGGFRVSQTVYDSVRGKVDVGFRAALCIPNTPSTGARGEIA